LVAVPRTMRKETLDEMHASSMAAHLGQASTYTRTKERFFWPTMMKDCMAYVRACDVCEQRKTPKNQLKQGLLGNFEVGCPFDRIGIDLVTPLPRSQKGNNTLVVCTDYATRYVVVGATKSGKACDIAEFLLTKIFATYGACRELHSDQGRVFLSDVIKEITKLWNTKQTFTSSYHPAANGLVEKANGVVVAAVSKLIQGKEDRWDEYIELVAFAINTVPQESSKFAPFYLMFGREPSLPVDVGLTQPKQAIPVVRWLEIMWNARALACENLQRAHQAQKVGYDRTHVHKEFEEGSVVRVFSPRRQIGRCEKLVLRWEGPCRVLEKVTPVSYRVSSKPDGNGRIETVHVSRMKHYNGKWEE